MATMTYKEQLLHPNWQRKRLEVMERDGFSCQICGDTESTLHVHHKQYAKGRMAWEYPNDELVTLCAVCHEYIGEENAKLRDVVAKLPVDGPGCTGNAAGLLAGWAMAQNSGLDFSGVYQNEPFSFLAGEVIAHIGRALNVDELFAMSIALWECPQDVIRDSMRNVVANISAQKAIPKK